MTSFEIDHTAVAVKTQTAIAATRAAANEAYDHRDDELCRALNLAAHAIEEALLASDRREVARHA